MIAALLALLTVWTTPAGETIYVKHCRTRQGGCEAYVSDFVANAYLAANHYDVPPELLIATAWRESGLNRDAVSGTGDRSEYQLNPRRALRNAKRSEYYASNPGLAYAMTAAEELDTGARVCGMRRGGSRRVVTAAYDLAWDSLVWEWASAYYNTGKCLRGLPYAKRVMRAARSLGGDFRGGLW